MIFPLAGNTKIAAAITNAIKEDRLPHAILIEGDVGTGRHTLASFIAAAAVCEDKLKPCGKCNACKTAYANSHPDITVTRAEDGKKNIAIAQIRALRNETFIKPHSARCRVFIIDGANTMNEQSQNALLKVLEEPTGHTVFILITESKATLLDTVISRCVVLGLAPPETSAAADYILKTTDFAEKEVLKALGDTRNNVGKALQILYGSENTKTENAAKNFLNALVDGDEHSLLCLTVPFEKSRVEAEKFVRCLKAEIAARLRENPRLITARAFAKIYDTLCEGEKSLNSNINLGLFFCWLVSRTTAIMNTHWRTL